MAKFLDENSLLAIRTFVNNKISTVYQPKGSETVANLNSASKVAGMNGYVYNLTTGGTLTNQDGSTVTVISGDNVVFLWNNGAWKWDPLGGFVDLSNYITLNTDQVINSTKTISKNKWLKFEQTIGTAYIKSLGDGPDYKGLVMTYSPSGVTAGTASIVIRQSKITMQISNANGNTTKNFDFTLDDSNNRSLSLDKLTDGTNSITVAKIIAKYDKPSGGIPASDLAQTYVVADEFNIQNGTGTKAVQQKQDGSGGTFDFTNKNPNATALDPTLTGQISFGGVGNFATSFGGKSQASGKRSLAEGTTTVAKGNYSHAEGDNCVALGAESHAEGNQTVTNGSAAHSEGFGTQALGNNTHAEGANTIVYAINAHAEGYGTIVKDNYVVVSHGVSPDPGPSPTPISPTPEELDALNGTGAHAEGHNNFVLGCGAHAEGDTTKAYGRLSHTEGRETQAGQLILRKTENNKDYYTPDQTKQFQHAEGEKTKAIGHASHAGGYCTVANYAYQTVVGVYNNNINGTLFEVGNGTADNNRSNAFEVYADGHAEISVMGATNKSLVTKQYADTKVTANSAITGATKCKITYDAKGLVTAGADLAASDIPSLDTSKITSGTFADARISSASTWNAKTKVNLNGSAVTSASIYAPTSSGTAGQVLQSNGSGQAPTWATVSGTGTVTSITAGNGLTTTSGSYTDGGTITISGTLYLTKTNVQSGTYTKVDVDEYGRIQYGYTLMASDIPNLPASKITSGKFNQARIPHSIGKTVSITIEPYNRSAGSGRTISITARVLKSDNSTTTYTYSQSTGWDDEWDEPISASFVFEDVLAICIQDVVISGGTINTAHSSVNGFGICMKYSSVDNYTVMPIGNKITKVLDYFVHTGSPGVMIYPSTDLDMWCDVE